MSRSAMILNKATTADPLEFWVKNTKAGKPRAYHYCRHTGKTAISLTECELAEATGTAIRVNEPEF